MVELFCGFIHPGDLVKVVGYAIAIGHRSDIDGDCAFASHGLDLGGPAVGEEVVVEVGFVIVGIVGHEGDGEGGEGVVVIV